MRLILAAVGKPRDPVLSAAIREYEMRAARYWPLQVYEIREEPARAGSTTVVRDRESERLAARVPEKAFLVACDAGGRTMSSEEFAFWLQRHREQARDIAFVIGGALGLGDALRERAAMHLALAPWTLPHELARLVLAEQLYRAGTILRGQPYHK